MPVRRALPLLTVAALALSACGDGDAFGLACPILAPGSGAELAWGASGDLPAGVLAADAIWLPAGATARADGQVSASRATLFLYGPRDRQGGLGACLDAVLADDARVTWTAPTDGEYVVALATEPAAGPATWSLDLACDSGCDSGDGCPTLTDLGCPDVRCDGELSLDAEGCRTCACRTDVICDARHAGGPWGTCVLPACKCPEPASEDEAVCGASGTSWPSPCHALCAADSPVACDATPDDCDACPWAEAPVCGGGGVTYRNRCEAECAGATVLYEAACADDCLAAPDDCDLAASCDHGLAFDPDGCLACACADSPPATCTNDGVQPLCATIPGLASPVTVGAVCVAVALGATDALAGPCGVACTEDADCAAEESCRTSGVLTGRCVTAADAPLPCSCGGLIAPVCGEDDATWLNACAAACAGVPETHLGACCGDPGAPAWCP